MDKKGSIILESAIVLPVFLLTILTVAMLIQYIGLQEKVLHTFQDEARRIAMEASVLPVPRLPFSDWKEYGVDDLSLRELRYLFTDEIHDVDDLIRIKIAYRVPLLLPVAGKEALNTTETLLFRGWTGRHSDDDPMSPKEMEEIVASQIVFIFPNEGGRYHSKDCGYVTVYPFETILSEKVRNQYDPCQVCNAEEGKDGELVYCFLKTGTVYHLPDCPTVDKTVIGIEKQDALDRGYLPCSRCKGGD